MTSDNAIASQIGRLGAELKTFIDNTKGEVKDTISAVQTLQSRIDEMDKRHASGGGSTYAQKSAGDAIVAELQKGDNLDMLRRSGRVSFDVQRALPAMDQKSAILSTGLFSAEAARGVEASGRWPYELRRNLSSLPTDAGSVFVLKETGYTNNASPQVEGDPKSESTFTFSGTTKPVVTVAHYVNFSKQALDDVPGLGQFLTNSLIWGLEAKIESAVLYGDGVTSLDGFTGNSTPLDQALLSPTLGWSIPDILSAAQTQLRASGYVGTHAVMHPNDWHRLVTAKGADGQYLIGSPTVMLSLLLWGLRVILSPEIVEQTCYVFDASRITMRERQAVTVDVSAEHSANFTSNLLTARCEWRGALVIPQAGAVIGGSLVSSPSF